MKDYEAMWAELRCELVSAKMNPFAWECMNIVEDRRKPSELESEPPKEAIQQARDVCDGKGMFCARCDQYVERGKIHKCKEPDRVVMMSEVRDIVREELRGAVIQENMTPTASASFWMTKQAVRIIPGEL